MNDISPRWLGIQVTIWIAGTLGAVVLQEPRVYIAVVIGSIASFFASGHFK